MDQLEMDLVTRQQVIRAQATTAQNFENVRRSVVRICFEYKKEKDYEWIVIAGTIMSIEGGEAKIAADSTLFTQLSVRKKCWVAFPRDGGYGEESLLARKSVRKEGDFHTFKFPVPIPSDYVRAVSIEIRALKSFDAVDAFIFPRERYITPAAYCSGNIIDGSQAMHKVGIVFNDCASHEYGYLGSPIFNHRGHFVGITFMDQSQLSMHTVWRLRDEVLKHTNSHYLLDGQEMTEADTEIYIR